MLTDTKEVNPMDPIIPYMNEPSGSKVPNSELVLNE